MLENGPVIKYHSSKEDFSAYPEATFPSRALAFFIDAVILGTLQTAFAALFDYIVVKSAPPVDAFLFLNGFYLMCNFVAIPSLYFIPQIKRSGQTIGKRVMRIKIIRDDNTGSLSPGRIFLREIVGKFVSAVFFGAGYMVRLFGLETFHDKIAKTRVVAIGAVD